MNQGFFIFIFLFLSKIMLEKFPKVPKMPPKCATNNFNSGANYLLLSFMRSSSATTNLST